MNLIDILLKLILMLTLRMLSLMLVLKLPAFARTYSLSPNILIHFKIILFLIELMLGVLSFHRIFQSKSPRYIDSSRDFLAQG